MVITESSIVKVNLVVIARVFCIQRYVLPFFSPNFRFQNRSNRLEEDYQTLLDAKVRIHPNGQLQTKPWRQKEFSILDPDKNLLTFGNEWGIAGYK